MKLAAFEYEESGNPTQKCPAPWFLAPFPYNIRVVTGSHDVEVNIHASSSASLIPIPTEPEENSSAKPPRQKVDPAPGIPPKTPDTPRKPGWIGMSATTLVPDLARFLAVPEEYRRGAAISDITKDGPAAQGRLEFGDVILSFDGVTVEIAERIQSLVAGKQIREQVTGMLFRKGRAVI